MATTQTQTTDAKDWLELKAEDLVRRTRASQYKAGILADAEYFRALGYVGDVALAKALEYWE